MDMSFDPSWKGTVKAGGVSLVAAGCFLFLFFLALIVVRTSPTLTPDMILDDAVPPVTLYTVAVVGELLLLPGGLGLFVVLRHVKKAPMVMGTALWLLAVLSFLVSRTQIIALYRINESYQTTTSDAMKAAS